MWHYWIGCLTLYQHLIVALDTLGDDSDGFTYEFLKSRLIQEEKGLEMKTGSGQQAVASALVSNRRRSTVHGSRPAYKCFTCGRSGHISRHCKWKNGQGVRSKISGSVQQKPAWGGDKVTLLVGSVQTDKEECEDKVGVANVATHLCFMNRLKTFNSRSGYFLWIFNLGCSTHVTFDRSHFVRYVPVENCTVEMGTKGAAAAAGKRSVKLEVQTEQYNHIVTLTNVLQVPDFGYSLLLVRALVKKGLSTTFLQNSCVLSSKGQKHSQGVSK